MTWARNRQLDNFWPLEWLPHEQGLESARISTFGYNAHFSATGKNSISNISDFAKNLLYDMRYGSQANSGPAFGDVRSAYVALK